MEGRIVVKIEKGVPIPKSESGNNSKYPLKIMEVGDSFLVPYKEGKKSRDTQSRMTSIIAAYRNKHDVTKKFVTKAEEGGVRVWRIK